MSDSSIVTADGNRYPRIDLMQADSSGLWNKLRRRWLVFLAAALATGALVGAAFLMLPKTYMGVSAVAVAPPQPMLDRTPPGVAEKRGDEADLQTQLLVVTSPRLLNGILTQQAVANALRNECETQQAASPLAHVKAWVGAGNSCDEDLGTPGAALDWLQHHLSVGVSGRSRVINIGYQSVIPAVAAQIANAVTDAFLQEKRNEVAGSRITAVQWLRGELDRRGEALRQSQMEVENYRSTHGLERGQRAPIASEQLSELAKQLASAEARKADAAATLQQLGNDPNNLDRAMQSPAVLNSHTISELRVRQAALGAQIAHLAATWGERSSVLGSLRQQEAAIARQIRDETTRIAASVRQSYANANQEVATLDRQVDQLKRRVGAAGDAEAAIAALVQTAQVQREIYLDLSKKANELETERRVLTGDAELVSYADTPIHVWFPKPIVFIAVGFVLSLGVGTGAAMLWDRRDDSVRAGDVLEAAVGSPVLARIPETAISHDRRKAICRGNEASPLQEAVRTLYASCLLLPRGDAPRTVLVTSAEPDEGKTFVTLNLAAFAASAGKRVLVIENDLRQPSFGRMLKLRPGKGLADFLRGKASFEEVLQHDEPNGFDVISAGQVVLDSTELVASPAMQRLIDTAIARYDLVLFDSPPSLVMMDARLLVSRMDSVLFCTRWGQSPMLNVAEGIKGIHAAGGRIAGLVVNRVRPREYRWYEGVPSLEYSHYVGRNPA